MSELSIKTNYDADIEENADVCIIGTGAGGSVVAHHLTHADKKVVMLERGKYYSMEYLQNESLEKNLMDLYFHRGAFLTSNFSATIAQGQCVGGSTMINYGICLKMPSLVFQTWRDDYGITITQAELDAAYSEIESLYSVNDLVDEGQFHELIGQGCDVKGYSHGWMRKAIKDGKKQNSLIAFLETSNKDNLKIYANCTAESVNIQGDTINSIIATAKDGNNTYSVKINAEKIVLSAGPIASSQFLLKNEIGNRSGKVGYNVSIHPSMSVIGEFDQRIDAENDTVMAYYCNEFSALKQDKPGHMIESAFVAPSQFSLVIPGYGLENLANVREKYDYVSMAGILVHDEAVGEVSLNGNGDAILKYVLSKNDQKEMVSGLKHAAEIYFAAGAKKVITGHIVPKILENESQIDEKITEDSVGMGKILTVSAHPQGGNQMGNESSSSVVNSYCKSHDLSNLYICDASVFPTSIGVNPQLTVMAIAKIAASHIYD